MVKARRQADRIFLVCLGILIIFGLAALMSSSSAIGFTRFNDTYFYIKRQILFGVLPGLILFIIFSKIDYHLWQKVALFFYGITLILLGLVFIDGIGLVINGSKSWVSFGNYSLQPAEIAKLSVIIMLALLLSKKEYVWNDWKSSLLPIVGLIIPALILIALQPDVGTLSIVAMVMFAMMMVGKVPARYLVIISLIGVLGFVGLIFAAPYRAQRLTTFLHPELDPKGVGYQVNQAFLAVGSGGFWGLGFGHSRQKFQYLPEVNADSIFAVIAEENGFLVSTGFVLLIVTLALRGLKIARGAPDDFGGLLVTGIVVWFSWQSFLNIGAMVGALPLTGVPLPFVSHGGSAMMMALEGAGLITNISTFSKI
ncbi:MAG: hypothetical protein A3D53_00500 [Candidatus Magasanikbacteria bacterium RIFCSPHIGHO2_02_FULL_45_10]|uniref:Probable peptidoglycan glycosyltransferase FtsW n=1 Tax=Candidatus Magasanikbacteria bacterium RIFCSPHIGHO2_02_FULL_45_10 TaxID=1798679 RepID=A0A1F6MCN5_9BACT|nr:MAG: hypothetical protein A3D53_00500 [Candidatus Magasanikbacteria bacterium RIFCSPHIGHO2_02_FULL_45_10]